MNGTPVLLAINFTNYHLHSLDSGSLLDGIYDWNHLIAASLWHNQYFEQTITYGVYLTGYASETMQPVVSLNFFHQNCPLS